MRIKSQAFCFSNSSRECLSRIRSYILSTRSWSQVFLTSNGFQLHYLFLSQTEPCVSWCFSSLMIREISWLGQYRQLCHFFSSHRFIISFSSPGYILKGANHPYAKGQLKSEAQERIYFQIPISVNCEQASSTHRRVGLQTSSPQHSQLAGWQFSQLKHTLTHSGCHVGNLCVSMQT